MEDAFEDDDVTDSDGGAVYHYTVGAEEAGGRVDKYLSGVCTDLSRARLQGLISQGQILLNSSVLAMASRKVEVGDVLEVRVPAVVPCKPQAQDIPLDVVFEDDDLMVINKPAGLVVHPGAGNPDGTLVNALLHYCAGALSGINGVARPGIVHRLDKETSGLMVVAKSDLAHHHLAAQLADRSLRRVYQALVLGVPVPLKGAVDRPIGRDRHNRLKMSVVGNARRDAKTHYLVKQDFSGACSLVECRLETGRTHQIRVHMEALGHPLVGDPLYGPQPTALAAKLRKGGYDEGVVGSFAAFPRQALHAQEICFIHPVTEEEMSFSSSLPDDFSNLLKLL
ncbi:MAG: RluA family pseudouridine synthase [Alphaproteobacteria bacterium]|nr:RluA family pseudouridine synthase [Alphaproteobacteria bacterium]